jgi:transmembrane sensor
LRWHCGDLSIAERFEYLTWLKTSPVHIAETLRMCRLYSWLEGTKLKLFITNEDTFSNVVELPPREREAVATLRANRASVWRVRIAAGVATVGLGAVLAFGTKLFYLDHTLQTRAGEWRSMPLSDGSSLTAAPYTRLHHDIGDEERVISLEQGKAMFRVAKDASRPFVVDAGPVLVTATGTKFTVERHGLDVSVTMQEGTVVVTPSGDSEATFTTASLSADTKWTLSGDDTPTLARVDGEEEASWVGLKLTFRDGATIGDAVAEFNSYNATKIVVDEKTSGRQLRGVFDAIDPLSFAGAVKQTADVSVVQESPELVRIGRTEGRR